MIGIAALRLAQLQLLNSRRYRRLAESNSTKIQFIIPPRGIIYDNARTALATNLATYRAYIIPREVKDIREIINLMREKFNFRQHRVNQIERQFVRNRRSFTPIFIRENITWKEMSQLRLNHDIPGLYVEQGNRRIYPFGTLGAHVIGYVGNVSEADLRNRFDPIMEVYYFKTGKTGIEKQFDAQLRGVAGRNIQMVNAIGKVIRDGERIIDPIPGENIHLNLGVSVQKALEDAMSSYPVCSGVVMEVESGRVLAMASHPNFDPGRFQEDDIGDYFEKLRSNPHKPFMNKTIEGTYPPGSTFKIVVAMAALEGGAIQPGERIFCDGHWTYGNHRYHCWKRGGHGWQNLQEALAHSCDVYFYQVALKIGMDAIKSMALKMGLGAVLQNDLLGEAPGIIPDRRWKERTIGARWVHGDTIISGIGQGFLLTTPLQLCTMLCRFISNAEISPRIVNYSSGAGREFESLGFNKKNIDIVLGGLNMVTRRGGTAEAAGIRVNGRTMGGKTGTSQVRRISEQERETGVRTNESLPWHLRNHGLFVGYAPTDNPKYAISVVTEHSGGSSFASAISAKVMRKLLEGIK